MDKIVFLLFFFYGSFHVYSQDDLLDEIDSGVENISYESAVFKGLKIVNFESTKLVNRQQFYFIISHRFGSVKNGIKDLFGLDQASTRIQSVYGITDGINVGFSRSKFQRTYDLALKYRLFRQQKNGFPFTIVGYNLLTVNTSLDKDLLPKLKFEDRLGYVAQILISRKFTKSFSLELMPTYFHDNYVANDRQDNSQLVMGIGGRLKITKRFSVNVDYGYHFNRASNSVYTNPLSVGVDIETGGHVFQLHFTNAQGMYENAFLGQASGDWKDGNFFFGFNLSRVFAF